MKDLGGKPTCGAVMLGGGDMAWAYTSGRALT